MYPRTFERGGSYLVMAAVVCLLLSVRLQADEAPANQNNTPAIVADLNIAVNTNLALNAIHLAANTDLIGADVAQVDDVLRSHLGLGEGKGLVVTGVGGDTPAAHAGIQKNDILIAVGNEEIAGLEAFRKSLEASAGKPITIGLIRAGKKQSIDVTPHAAAALIYNIVNQRAAEPKYWLGVGLAGADDTLRSQLSLAAGEGLVVTSVESDSPSTKAGVLVNDLLLKLDGKSLTTIEALTEQLQAIGDKSVALELLRRGKPATLTVTPEKHADAVTGGLAWLHAAELAGNLQTVDVGFPTHLSVANLIAQPAQPELARQLADLEAQVMQIEAAIAALRSTIDAGAQPSKAGSAEGGPDKNAEKK